MDGILLRRQKPCIWDINFKFIWCQIPYQLQKISTWANFLEFRFFLPEKSRLYRYYQNKNQLGFTSSSYMSLAMNLLIKFGNSPKSRVKMKFYIFGKPYLNFASDRLFIFSGFIVLQVMMQIN